MSRSLRLRVALAPVALAALLAGCGSGVGDGNPFMGPRDGSVSVDRGPSITPSGNVAIEIHSPMEGDLRSSNGSVDVSAGITVKDGTDFVDPASVVATITAKDGGPVLSMAKLTGPIGTDEYRGSLGLAGLKSGEYRVTISAATTTGKPNQKDVVIQVDAGPQITVISPTPGQHYKGGLVVQLVADAGALGPLDKLQATIAGIPVNLEPTASAPNQFRAVFDFNQPKPPLDGEQLFNVSAENRNHSRTDIRFTFVVDNQGPTITNTAPPPGAVVGSVIKISARIEDGAGLNNSSIIVLIGDVVAPQFRLALMPEGGGVYSVFFDTKNLTQCAPVPSTTLCVVHPTLSFRAADQLGNETVLAYEIAIDNIPPVADMTPPEIRVSKRDAGLRCSFSFDPLSRNSYAGDMPDDLCMVPQLFDLRARIQDDSNRGSGLKLGPLSLVDPEATAVYVLDNVAQPLIVDTDGDGYCDAVNPKLVPTTTPLIDPRQVLKLRLSPVPPAGTGDFRSDQSLPALDPNAPGDLCYRGRDADRPDDLCPTNQPSIAISYTVADEPAIWAIDPVNAAYCFGGQFDTLANNIADDGWKCIAIATADHNGNRSVSAPLRVYLDRQYGYPRDPLKTDPLPWCKPAPAGAGPPPSCTGTYDRATDTATTAPCKTRRFTDPDILPGGTQEVCYLGNCR